MANHVCCSRNLAPASRAPNNRRLIGSTKWIVPTAIVALMPKCPMCVAAYIALATGVGVSLSVATWIRLGLIATCLCALIYLSIRPLVRLLVRIPRH